MIGGLPLHPRSRIAPTPSGFLHEGNLASFLFTHDLVRRLGGSLSLRIDDLDAERVRPAYVRDLFDQLSWLGITWDEGPRSPDDLQRTWSQSFRLDRYLAMVHQLKDLGLLYACNCSRKRIREAGGGERYPGTCRDLGLPLDSAGVAWRVRLPDPCEVTIPTWPGGEVRVDLAGSMGDPVVLQRNGRPSYQIASLTDDLDQRTDLIVRGEDLLGSTACQVHLAEVLGHRSFAQATFIHHPLVRDAQGRKLSKTAGDGTLAPAGRDDRRLARIIRLRDRLEAGLSAPGPA